VSNEADIAVVGGGAAGLMAGISAARRAPTARVVVLEGARKLGTKILIAGGGRCNVTHEAVRAEDFAGSSRGAIRKVLGRFDVERTIAFFAELGVALKREETGKLFPTTNSARTVLQALRTALADAGAELLHPRRVERVTYADGAFAVEGEWGALEAVRVILATGGRSLPSSGSDGGGYTIAAALGHGLTRDVFPALVPLVLPEAHPLRALAGVSTDVTLTVCARSGKHLTSCRGSLLCTHFGVSGPAVLDVSRHLAAARTADKGAHLVCDWLPDVASEQIDDELQAPGPGAVLGRLRGRLPERLARALSEEAGVDCGQPASRLVRDARRALVRTLKRYVLPVVSDRGWNFAEVTAGGIPLVELELSTMESRRQPGLYVCGEVCDVDGRIGGFNFQWAWASGYVAGTSAAESIA
jgi:predicted Rossmann fold flavoprotein